MVNWPPEMLNRVKSDAIKSRMAKSIAVNIAYYRKLRGMTQDELATLLGRKQPQVARWERQAYGRHTLNSLVQIATALDIEVADLFKVK